MSAIMLLGVARLIAQEGALVQLQAIDGQGLAMGSVIVTLQADSAGSVLAYALTDEAGRAELSARPGRYRLTARYLGCQEVVRPAFEVGPGMEQPVQLVFDQCGLDLPSLEVTAEAPAMQIKGDTLIFKADRFATGQERNLSDLLGVLPGLSVDEQGQFSYQGRSIDELRLEGNDVFNNQHQLAGSGLRAAYIDRILVVDNFREAADLQSADSRVLALDIRLKEAYKGAWQGDLEMGAGWPLLAYNGQANGLKVNSRSAGLAFGRANNNGTPVLRPADFLRLQPDLPAALTAANGDLRQLIPEGLLIEEGLSANADALLAGNMQVNGERHRWRAAGLSALMRRARSQDFTWVFPDGGEVLSGQQELGQPAWVQQAQGAYARWEPEAWTLETSASALFTQNRARHRQQFEGSPELLQDRLLNQQLRLQAQLGFQRQWSAKWFSEALVKGRSAHLSQQFYSNFEHPSGALALLEGDNRREGIVDLQLQHAYRSGQWEYSLALSGQLQQWAYRQDGQQQVSVINQHAKMSWLARRSGERGSLELEPAIAYLEAARDGQAPQGQWAMLGAFRLRQQLGKGQRLTAQLSRNVRQAAPLQVSGIRRFSSYDRAEGYTVPVGALFTGWQLSAGYFSVNAAARSRWAAQASLQYAPQAPGVSSERLERFLLLQTVVVPGAWGSHCSIHWGKSLASYPLKWSIRGSQQWQKGYLPRAEGEAVFQALSYQLQAEGRTVRKERLNGTLSLSFAQFDRKSAELSFRNQVHRYQARGEAVVQAGGFAFRPGLEIAHFRNGAQRLTVENVQLSVEWKPQEGADWGVTLSGHDLTHLRGATDARAVWDGQVLINTTFQRLPGSLLLGLRYAL
ncbi:carboxypeptidase-like regulatory domain-containing protein [Phaeodactylibacter luteus]|uniref:Carboxypeptidase regulatory-like domain-containing protein n=1 Tax=Phaeodactylibacter luteus TaxID=1564516 RepID=A0A5C6RP67_9BACT|nr:carboxypeptidase-like regulatory domain-containing protein [Phaeodactylibacter luteus]TXB64128.1 carboxypeptidase regulatory-like domain-containing protein [Phaeodactylibacter luteus]